jgi:hypothetical protein
MTDKQPEKSKTPKSEVKRPSKGYRKFLRRQKEAARKTVGSRVDPTKGKEG